MLVHLVKLQSRCSGDIAFISSLQNVLLQVAHFAFSKIFRIVQHALFSSYRQSNYVHTACVSFIICSKLHLNVNVKYEQEEVELAFVVAIIYSLADLLCIKWVASMESPVVNLHNQFQKLITQVDGLNDGIETRKLCLLVCL